MKKLKVIIQLPCYNESETLPVTLKCLPKELEGIATVEWLIIDDGSGDNTSEVAAECGAHHIVCHSHNMGLARGFMTGIKACLEQGADIIVNTDADNQYNADDIPKLLEPILDGRAQYVIGTRPISQIEHFSFSKKILQKIGSLVVRLVSGTKVEDAPCGFRAFTREAALKLNVFNEYTYTIETIIQAGRKNIPIATVPIRVNKDLRPSRLVKSVPSYIKRSIGTMLRIFVVYHPFGFFATIGAVLFSSGVLLGSRFLYWWFQELAQGMVQSLILAAVLLIMGFMSFMMALLADLLGVNRSLLEEQQYYQRLREFSGRPEKERR